MTGKALEVYLRMLDAAATDYRQLREALLRRYDLKEDGYRLRFRRSRPEPGESPEQFSRRLRSYLGKWMTMSRTSNTAESVKDLFVEEQFLNSWPKDLAAHLREKELANLDDMATSAVRFLIAHNRRFHGTVYDLNKRQSFSVEDTSLPGMQAFGPSRGQLQASG